MIALNLAIDNFYAFNDFNINFVYKKKEVNPLIENEFLSYCPTFRYKKFVSIMGGNASGKTTLGKMLLNIVNFIKNKEYSNITSAINDKHKESFFVFDFVGDDRKVYRLSTKIDACLKSDYNSNNIHCKVESETIKKNDNYEKCIKSFSKEIIYANNYIKELEKISHLSWMFKFVSSESTNNNENNIFDNNKYLSILNDVLKILDSRIMKIEKIKNAKNAYVIKYPFNEVIIEDGIIRKDILSSGTKAGIDIAHLIASMKHAHYGFYYCDEKFSYVHSEIEKAFVSIMIDYLGDDEQLLLTTHNSDLLDMNLPHHSFVFITNDSDYAPSISGNELLKRNTDSIRCAYENDAFRSLPNTERIYKLNDER